DRFSFNANKKVNIKLEKDRVRLNCHCSRLNTLQDRHNVLVQFVASHSSTLELHCHGLLSLRGKMCMCHNQPESPVDGSGEAPSFSSPSTPCCEPSPSPPTVEVESVETPIVAPEENVIPIPVRPPSSGPCCTVVESSTTL
ncbi:hypothetical protein BDM02DRAFT_3193188, partial [Thelephora ganbajun]